MNLSNIVPMPRSIKDVINKTISERKFNIENGDIDFVIVPTNFKTNNEAVKVMSKKFTIDISEGAHVFKSVNIETVSFKRKQYISASLDLFDVVRNLTKKGYLLFKYILDNIDYDSNRIDLPTKLIGEIIGSDICQIKSNALRELINNKLIEKVDTTISKHMYAINIQEYFKGNFTDFIYRYRQKYGVVKDECSNRQNAND